MPTVPALEAVAFTVADVRQGSIYEGEIGVFILNNESYIKKMGRNELISLNPAYNPIKLHEYDDIRCAGKVLGTLDMQ